MTGRGQLLSAGIVVVACRHERRRYLLLRAYQYWDFPKGLVEAGEDPLETACREVAEETGISDLDFGWGYDYYETGPYAEGKIARYYVAATTVERVELRVNPELGRPEHHEYRWVGFEEGRELLGERVRAVLDWADARTGGEDRPADRQRREV